MAFLDHNGESEFPFLKDKVFDAMCLAIPGKIEEFIDAERHFARADICGVKRQINVDLIKEQGLEVGDWVLIHVGFAMGKISEEHALEQLELLAILGEADQAGSLRP